MIAGGGGGEGVLVGMAAGMALDSVQAVSRIVNASMNLTQEFLLCISGLSKDVAGGNDKFVYILAWRAR